MTDLSSCFNNPCWHPKFRNCCCCCCCNSVSISFKCGSPIYSIRNWLRLLSRGNYVGMDQFIWYFCLRCFQDSTCTEGCISTSPNADGVIEGEIAYTSCNPTPAFRALSTTDTGDCKWVWSGEYWDLGSLDFKCKPGFNCIMHV